MIRRVIVATVALLAFASAARATTTDPLLDAVASRIAGQEVSVLCYEPGEPEAPEWFNAWGYVYPWLPVEHMAPEVCEGALGIGNPAVADWKKALGAMVLAHESYHLAHRYGNTRLDEARTQCRAIRHTRYVMLFLGATEAQAESLMPWALALHWWVAAKAPQYHFADCQVPNPY